MTSARYALGLAALALSLATCQTSKGPGPGRIVHDRDHAQDPVGAGHRVAVTEEIRAHLNAAGCPEQVGLPLDADDALDLVPFQRRRNLPGKVRGLIFMPANTFWGISFGHNKRRPQRDTYLFTIDDLSPFVLYFPSDGEGYHLIRSWKLPTPAGDAVYDAAMFNRDTPNPWGLERTAHIVELEVNGGRGSKGLHFVATDVRLLDAGVEYPFKADELLAKLAKRFGIALRERQVEVDQRFEALGKSLQLAYAGHSNAGPPDLSQESGQIIARPTWLTEQERLSVTYVYVRTGELTASRPPDHWPSCPDGAPCAQPGPIIAKQSYRVSFGATYRTDRDGEVTSEQLHRVAARCKALYD